MELREVRVIVKHTYDFFRDNRLEDFIKNIPIQKLETQISEINKLALVKMVQNLNSFLLVIQPQAIQLHLKSLEQLELAISLLNLLEEEARKQLQVEIVLFNGEIHTKRDDTYNQAFANPLPDKIKVKMLGIDIQSTNFEYRVSLNKHTDLTKVNVKTLMQCEINELSQKVSIAFEELGEELKQLQELF